MAVPGWRGKAPSSARVDAAWPTPTWASSCARRISSSFVRRARTRCSSRTRWAGVRDMVRRGVRDMGGRGKGVVTGRGEGAVVETYRGANLKHVFIFADACAGGCTVVAVAVPVAVAVAVAVAEETMSAASVAPIVRVVVRADRFRRGAPRARGYDGPRRVRRAQRALAAVTCHTGAPLPSPTRARAHARASTVPAIAVACSPTCPSSALARIPHPKQLARLRLHLPPNDVIQAPPPTSLERRRHLVHARQVLLHAPQLRQRAALLLFDDAHAGGVELRRQPVPMPPQHCLFGPHDGQRGVANGVVESALRPAATSRVAATARVHGVGGRDGRSVVGDRGRCERVGAMSELCGIARDGPARRPPLWAPRHEMVAMPIANVVKRGQRRGCGQVPGHDLDRRRRRPRSSGE